MKITAAAIVAAVYTKAFANIAVYFESHQKYSENAQKQCNEEESFSFVLILHQEQGWRK